MTKPVLFLYVWLGDKKECDKTSTFSMYGLGTRKSVTKRVLFLCMAWGQERGDKTSTFSMYGLGTRKSVTKRVLFLCMAWGQERV